MGGEELGKEGGGEGKRGGGQAQRCFPPAVISESEHQSLKGMGNVGLSLTLSQN